MDNPKKKGIRDDNFINRDQDHEVEYFLKELYKIKLHTYTIVEARKIAKKHKIGNKRKDVMNFFTKLDYKGSI